MCSDASKGLYTEVSPEPWIHKSACTHVNYSSKWRAWACQYPPHCFSVFKFIPYFLHCALLTTGISLITDSVRSWMIFPICVSGMKSLFCLLSSPVVVYKAAWVGKCGNNIFLIFHLCAYEGCVSGLNETLVTPDSWSRDGIGTACQRLTADVAREKTAEGDAGDWNVLWVNGVHTARTAAESCAIK